MAFMKFSKGKTIYSVPNGLGDGSAYFDGSSYAILNDVSKLPYGNSPRTISIWFYSLNGSTSENETLYETLFCYGKLTQNQIFSFGVHVQKSSFGVWGRDNSIYYTYYFETKKWYHVVVTFDSNYEEKVYINNELIGTETHSNINTVQDTSCIGAYTDGYYSEYLNGNLKDLMIYDRVLSAEEVTTLYNKGTVADGLVLNIPLQVGKDDDSMFSSKNFVYDYSTLTTSSGFDEWGYPIRYDIASEANITLFRFIKKSTVFALDANKGDTELVNGLTPTYSNRTCLSNSTFSFDGDSKYATYPTQGVSNVNLGTGAFTIEWDCSIGTSHNGRCPSFINMGASWLTAGCYIIQWQRQGSGRFSSHWNGQYEDYPTDAFPQFNGDGLYHHVAITRADDGLYCFWVDGKRLSDTYTRTMHLDLNFANLDFGYNRIDGGRLQYDMKHFRISNECLYTEDFNIPKWVGN